MDSSISASKYDTTDLFPGSTPTTTIKDRKSILIPVFTELVKQSLLSG